jgi:hypothetical protein
MNQKITDFLSLQARFSICKDFSNTSEYACSEVSEIFNFCVGKLDRGELNGPENVILWTLQARFCY